MCDNLEEKGWIKTTTIDEPRLSEIIEEYKLLGFDVLIKDVNINNMTKECEVCYKDKKKDIKTVYIKKKKS